MAKKDINIKLGVDTSGYSKDWKDVVKATLDGGKAATKEAQYAADAIVKQIEKIGQTGTLKQASRQMDNLVGLMSKFGMQGSAAFNEVTKQAGHLKAELDDVAGFIKAARPDAPFQALNTVLGAGAQAFAGLQGAMALFGAESEDVQKTLLKVQAAMAFAEGFKAIDQLEDGFKQLWQTIQMNPMGATVAIVSALAAATVFYLESLDTLSTKQKAYHEIQSKAIDAYVKEEAAMRPLLNTLNKENVTREEKKQVIDELNKHLPDYLGKIDAEKAKTEDVTRAILSYLGIAKIRAKVQAAQELYVEALKKQMTLEAQQAKHKEELDNSAWARTKNQLAMQSGFSAWLRTDYAGAIEQSKKDVDAYGDAYDGLSDQLDKANEQAKKFFKTISASGTKTPAAPKQQAKGSFLLSPSGATSQANTSDLTGKGLENTAASAKTASAAVIKLTTDFTRLTDAQKKFLAASNAMSDALKTLIADTLIDFGEAIGSLLSGSDTALQDFGKKALMAIVGFMETLAKAQIATAIASEAFQKMLFTNPTAALGAGIALAVAAGVVKSMLAKGPEVAGLAQGGIIPAGFPNDTFPAMLSSNEMVIPLDKRGGMGGTPQLVPIFDGRQLLVMIRYAERDFGRG